MEWIAVFTFGLAALFGLMLARGAAVCPPLGIQAVGLGYGKPADGLMSHKPRAVDEPILDRVLYRWLGLIGLVQCVATLGVIAWAENAHGTDVARTMGLTTFALGNLLFSIATRDERHSVFSLDTFADRKFLLATGLSFVAIVIGSQTDVLQRILKTESLTLHEWLTCACAAASVIVASELRKLWLGRRSPAHQAPAS